jgi:hypothetical protein
VLFLELVDGHLLHHVGHVLLGAVGDGNDGLVGQPDVLVVGRIDPVLPTGRVYITMTQLLICLPPGCWPIVLL